MKALYTATYQYVCTKCRIRFNNINVDQEDSVSCPKCKNTMERYNSEDEDHQDIDDKGETRRYLKIGDTVSAYEGATLSYLGPNEYPSWRFISFDGDAMHDGDIIMVDSRGHLYTRRNDE